MNFLKESFYRFIARVSWLDSLSLEMSAIDGVPCENIASECVYEGFYPTALQGCRGIVFTLGVRVGDGKKFVRAVSQKL